MASKNNNFVVKSSGATKFKAVVSKMKKTGPKSNGLGPEPT